MDLDKDELRETRKIKTNCNLKKRIQDKIKELDNEMSSKNDNLPIYTVRDTYRFQKIVLEELLDD